VCTIGGKDCERTTMILNTILSFIILFAGTSNGFVLPRSSSHKTPKSSSRHHVAGSDVLDLLTNHGPHELLLSLTLKEGNADFARGEFYFYFAAGSGAGGIGLAQVPKFFQWITDNRSLDGVGPTAGGTTLETGLASVVYPTLYEKDVSQIIQKMPTAERIVSRGTSQGYMASKGYIVREDFNLALKGCNPLAISATYDALTRGSGDALSPVRFQEAMDQYRAADNKGTNVLVQDLQAAALTKGSAFVALSFLLFILFFAIGNAGIRGFL